MTGGQASTPFDQFSKQSLSFRWLTLLVECGTHAGHKAAKRSLRRCVITEPGAIGVDALALDFEDPRQ